ncbi:alanine racemase [Candidatus Daviesbacteria bacterium RIFCSPHIGHO2_01_FULL_44_29]|uniref:Alanine racemase n=1 Tax=Candidatus Daviesbacteria bacterium RIFCSPHIGHO2_02_FULL_43_12 TaxID=1797776 RepID=A0A1F5KHN8_9BACT|nr:MAG: alanine racemase [Candidatus Daviesbacteria bacterium RIFCSPHIGHO2_01_FULL_44_29]OGE39831.1 MAG: alanine racemase [Candidatus Daviesbacteria bacterium RIFCSPHIGHO2_12_FULL_47_45]OGE40453.1 MAG: alanine racemase [Candidatus Daviesbacteria bacterium RIFCSPHIGHO2_02_FULL_43_12]OGE70005.1 MAG: alanine racemase [Candidatus Daviesbacteria bacterium RIFCSPLOWO2_01_FULL_43_15]
MLNFTNWFRKTYQVLNRIEISQSALLRNYRKLSTTNQRLAIAPVLKSNAYGHGLEIVGKILDKESCPFYCLDSLHEAYALHKCGSETPILIMGYINPKNLKVKKLPFQFAVYDLDFLEALNKYQQGAKVHIFVDTGMCREGVSLVDLPKFLEAAKKLKHIQVVGLMSHFASASSEKSPLFRNQLTNFKKAKEIVKKTGLNPKWIHIGASEVISHQKVRNQVANISNLVRIGKELYGITWNTELELSPVMKLLTHISQIKQLKRGDLVGYDGTLKATRNLTAAILPIGYYDGVDRRLSNKGCVTINGVVCPIIGRVSMNITTVDTTQVRNPFVGQEVVVYSDNPSDPNAIRQVAQLVETVASEILCREALSTRRVVTP